MKKIMKKLTVLALALMMVLVTVPAEPVQAAPKYTGTYVKRYKVKGHDKSAWPTHAVIINRVKGKNIRFQIEKFGLNGNYIYATKVINAKIKDKTVSFKWKDTWGNKGKGTLKLYKNKVKLKMVQTKTSKWNRSTLETDGYVTFPRRNGNTTLTKW